MNKVHPEQPFQSLATSSSGDTQSARADAAANEQKQSGTHNPTYPHSQSAVWASRSPSSPPNGRSRRSHSRHYTYHHISHESLAEHLRRHRLRRGSRGGYRTPTPSASPVEEDSETASEVSDDADMPPPLQHTDRGVGKLLNWNSPVPGVPDAVTKACLLQSYIALACLAGEIVLESLIFSGTVPKVEFRLTFVAVTIASVMLAFHTLAGVRDNDLDTTSRSLRLGIWIEVCLVIGDVEYIAWDSAPDDTELYRVAYRTPFIVLTTVNVFLLLFAVHRLEMWAEVGCCLDVFWPSVPEDTAASVPQDTVGDTVAGESLDHAKNKAGGTGNSVKPGAKFAVRAVDIRSGADSTVIMMRRQVRALTPT